MYGIKKVIDYIITCDNIEEIKAAAYSLESILVNSDSFPSELFDLFLDLLSQDDFLKMKESHYLVCVLYNSGNLLTEKQKTALLPKLTGAYEHFEDWMSWFVCSEILGEHFHNKEALDALLYLKNVEDGEARSFIAHGLERLALLSEEQLSNEAISELTRMKNDHSEKVRYEASLSLNKISMTR